MRISLKPKFSKLKVSSYLPVIVTHPTLDFMRIKIVLPGGSAIFISVNVG